MNVVSPPLSGDGDVRVVAVIDADDFVLTSRRRGAAWAQRQLSTASDVIAATAAPHAQRWEHEPPDAWVLHFTGPDETAVYSRAVNCSRAILAGIAAHTETTASAGISRPRRGGSAEDGARRALAAKLVVGGNRLIEEPPPAAFTPTAPRVHAELLHAVRAGDRTATARLAGTWVDACCAMPGADPERVRTWVAGLVIDVAAARDPANGGPPAGALDWLGAAGGLGLADLAEVHGIHERSFLRWWLQRVLDRLVEPAPTDPGEALMRRAESYLAEHFPDPRLSLRVIARDLAVSSYHLAHAYRRQRDTTFLTEVTTLRMARARQLLVTTNLRLPVVAQECGYPSTRGFRAAFKRAIGTTPSEFRARRANSGAVSEEGARTTC